MTKLDGTRVVGMLSDYWATDLTFVVSSNNFDLAGIGQSVVLAER